MNNLPPEDDEIWMNQATMQCDKQSFCWKEFLAVLVVLSICIGLVLVTGWVEKL